MSETLPVNTNPTESTGPQASAREDTVGLLGNAYQALTEQHATEDQRWAFGAGFDQDPLAGIEDAIPGNIPGEQLGEYCVMLGDDALIAAQRLTEWCTNAPELEDEVALANIALDLLGQARMLYSRSAKVDGSFRDEDDFAYFREPEEFRNVTLAELADADFAQVIVRLLFFATWRLGLLRRLRNSRDPVLAAIASKAVNENEYHREYAMTWTVRLGDGTEESHHRMRKALTAVEPALGELFIDTPIESGMAEMGVGVRQSDSLEHVGNELEEVLNAATLPMPDLTSTSDYAGRQGIHSKEFRELIGQMQSLARRHPDARW